MFINFSNHPSRLWAEEERNAALQYGTIEDLFKRAEEKGEDPFFILLDGITG